MLLDAKLFLTTMFNGLATFLMYRPVLVIVCLIFVTILFKIFLDLVR